MGDSFQNAVPSDVDELAAWCDQVIARWAPIVLHRPENKITLLEWFPIFDRLLQKATVLCPSAVVESARGVLKNIPEHFLDGWNRDDFHPKPLPASYWSHLIRGFQIVRDSIRTPDSEPDTEEEKATRLPDTPDVRDLCRLLQQRLPRGETQIAVAREFTQGDEKKAESLLRQARRFRSLWERPR